MKKSNKKDQSQMESAPSSIVAQLFYGQIDERDVFPFPTIDGEKRETIMAMGEAVLRYGKQAIDSKKLDEESLIGEEIYRGLSELGLMGVGVPEEFGGLGQDATGYAKIFSYLSTIDSSVATMLGAHQSIGYKALVLYGTQEQKDKYLPRLATGEMLAAFCLTEPSSGSDAYSIRTKAEEKADGSFSISGQKLWITNGGRADFYTVFCKTKHQINGKVREKISCFFVEKGAPGLSFGEKEDKMGIRASETRAVFFDQVHVPKENMIGEPGAGFKIAMNVLNSGRFSLGSSSVGAMERIFSLALKHACERKQFNQKLISFGIIQDKLARMLANIYTLESMVYLTTGRMDQGQKDYSLESAICKVYASERLWETVDMGLQIAGGIGYMREYPYERMMRDARINLIFEGTNEILRVFIALSGMRGPGETLKDVGKLASSVTKALLDPIKSVGILTHFVKRRIDKMMSKTLSQCHPKMEEHGANWSKMLSAFSIDVENTLMKYGKNIIGNELPQKRIADMAIALYSILSVLSRTTSILNRKDVDEEKKRYMVDLADIACRQERHRFMAANREMDSNLDKQIKRVTAKCEEYGGHGFDILDY
ncbi:MAG: acyl-CoA dehydrogenase family protein [Bacteriovoracales bacterium]|nr:acyl-CoA dehydrogenase family protein [Bacteriovoracales bacterium]